MSRVRLLLLALAAPLALADNTCVNFPAQGMAGSIPFASIAYVTATNSAGDHLIVGSLINGASEIGVIKANLPLPAFQNQVFCGQVQLAPGQFYSSVYVPTAAELSGNFGAFAGLLLNPANNQPYANGIIPPAQLGGVFAWRIGPTQVASALQGWSATGSMAVTRLLHTAVLLPSGKVMLVGGAGSSVIELYDPTTGVFQNAGQTLVNHGSSVGAIVLNDGRVLIEGGTSAPTAAEIFDPVTGAITPTASLSQPHGYYQTATLLADGRVLVVGGQAGSDFSISTNSGAEIYDPKTSKFTTAGAMAVNRRAHTATLLADGRVLIAGGETGSPTTVGFPVLNTAEIFDPLSGQFSQTGSMQVQRDRFFAVRLSNGNVLVGGGFTPGGSAELFDPTTGTFTPTGSMRLTRANPAVAVLSSGLVLVAGGNNHSLADNTAELYDPQSGIFTPTGSMSVGRNSSQGTALLDGKILVTGGDTQICCTFPLSSAELYTAVAQGLVLSQTGLTFRAAQGAQATLPAQTVAALSTTDTIPWTVSTHTYTGGNWLTMTPSSGSSVPGTPVTLSINANPAGLAAQDYYGSVTLTPTDGKHPPVSIAIVLSIVPAGAPAPPGVTPSGIVFLTAPGATVKPQSFTISNLTSSVIGFNGTASANPNWFSFSPKAAGIPAGGSATITVTPTLTGLSASVFQGSITLTFADKSSQIVNLLLVTTGSIASPSGQAAAPRAAAACIATTLLPVFTSLGSGFTTPVAWPNALAVQVVDDCGNLMNTGTVAVSFSNGDAPLSLLSIGSGTWTGTWVPVHNSTSAFSVRADAQQAPLTGSVQVTGQVATNPNVPLIAPGGVLSSGDYTSAPALGLLVSIFGSALANGNAGAGSLPLPEQLGSTSVIVSGVQLPVLYVSDSQVNVLIPYNLAANAPHQLIVQRGNAISVPVPIAVFDSQPAILATAGNGTGQGHIYKVDAAGNQVLADANSPATAGDTLVIYTVGLGAVSPPVNAGDPAPSNPLSQTAAPVTLTIGGQQATVFFSGLTPGSAGLYQVNAIVPPGITPGAQVPVAVYVTGKSSSGNIYMGIQ